MTSTQLQRMFDPVQVDHIQRGVCDSAAGVTCVQRRANKQAVIKKDGTWYLTSRLAKSKNVFVMAL